MAKRKKLAKKINRNKKKVKEINHFELKINKNKQNILGRKLNRREVGAPAMSRSKAINKRKKTLLAEYNQLGKSNRFLDKRFGENQTEITLDEKMMKRFATEHQKQVKVNMEMYEDSDTELTHRGQSLATIEQFDKSCDTDSDDDDNPSGKISGDIVQAEHFGGFLKKTEKQEDKSWRERMEEVISKSKQDKLDKQSSKERALELTEKLDDDWKELRLVMSSIKRDRPEATVKTANKENDYDIIVKQLQYETKAKATDRLKTEEEQAKEDKELLEKLERERLQRMYSTSSQQQQLTHQSADDLDEQFQLPVQGHEDNEEDKNETVDDDGSEESDYDNDSSDALQCTTDLLSDNTSNDDDDDDDDKLKVRSKNVKKSVHFDESLKVKGRDDVDIPYTFTAPNTYEELVSLLNSYDVSLRATVIERLRKCYHPSLAEGNKQKLEKLLQFLLDYLVELTNPDIISLDVVNQMTQQLLALVHLSPLSCANSFVELIHQLHHQCHKSMYRDKSHQLCLLIYVKLVGVLFQTSDYKHVVVTPAMILIGELITMNRCQSALDVASGLFLSTTLVEFVSFSKRVVPEVIYFLQQLFSTTTHQSDGALFTLVLRDPSSVEEIMEPLSLTKLFTADNAEYLSSDVFKLQCTHVILQLLIKLATLYKDLPSFHSMFSKIANQCQLLQSKSYPHCIENSLAELVTLISKEYQLKRITLRQQVVALKQFEPRIVDSFDGKKKRVGDREKQQQQRLIHKHRRELKGAMREIRRDTQFIGREKLNNIIHRDNERKRKVKEIYQQLSTQEGEWKAMKRKQNKT